MEADEDGVTAKNTYGGPLLLRTEFNGTEEITYEYMYNAHGDVVTLLTDGEVVATYYYDSFGNILDQTGEVSNSILYAGYQYDEETGLYYINARMYDPVTARFLQADTYLGNLNDPLSLNLYTYCLNNPHKYVDPSGHSVLLAFLLVVAVSFAVGAGMEYINQRFIEQRDVINYDLILYEGIFNAVIAAVSFGTANLGATAARQGLRLTARTTTRAVGRSMAFGAMEGATEELGRQLVEGKSFTEIDYGQVAFSATINGITGGIGGYSGAKKEAFDYARQATKSNVRNMAQMGVGVDDVVELGTPNGRVKMDLQFFASEGKSSAIDYDAVKKYIRDIENKTGYSIHATQKNELKERLRTTVFSKLSPEDTAKHRRQFTTKVKNKAIDEWQNNTGQIWPRYVEPVYGKKGVIVRNIGDPYDAHHIIENSYNGAHEWWNITPAKFPDEHQMGIHGVNSPCNSLFK